MILEGALFYGLFPYMGELLLIERPAARSPPRRARPGSCSARSASAAWPMRSRCARVIGLLGVRRMCIVGSIAAGGAFAALVGFRLWWLDGLAMAVAGLSYYMLHNSLQTEATEVAPTARGSAVALFACGFFAGQAVGPLLFGALLHAFGFPAALLACFIGLVGLGQLVVRRIID